MARRASQKTTWTKGELSPELYERTDLAHYYNAAKTMRNVRVLPQGGFTRRGGTWASKARRHRMRLEPVPIAASQITPHNGGVAAYLVDEDASTVFTTNPVGNDPFVVLEVDLGAARQIAFVDLIGFSCASGSFDNALAVEYSNGGSFATLAGPDDITLSPRRNIRTAARNRRFGTKPGAAPSARYWRVTLTGAVGSGAFSVQGLRLWAEKSVVSPVRILAFAKQKGEVYEMALSERNIDVLKDGVYQASIAVAVGAEVAEVNASQSLDTLLLFHEDLATPRIVRQGSGLEWNSSPMPWTNVGNLDANTAFGDSQDEVQRIAFAGVAAGNRIVLELGEQMTGVVTYTSSATIAAEIAAAVLALPGMSAGVTASLVGVEPTVEVRFSGAAANRRWPRLRAYVLETAILPLTTIVQQGLDASGLAMGEATGYPRCGTFHQSRIILGGFRGAPSTLLASMSGDVTDFTRTGSPITADLGLQLTLDTDEMEIIREVFVGRHLQVFSDRGEWWSDNRVLDATQPVNMIRATAHGIETAVPIVLSDTATVFLSKGEGSGGGRVLRDYQYQDLISNYEAEPLSLLGPHLLTGVVDMARRKPTSTEIGELLWMVNADGSIALLPLHRKQELLAMSPVTFDGQARAVAVNADNATWFSIERTIAGAAAVYLEKWDPDLLLDAAVPFTGPTSVVSGLTHLEGKSIYVLADGDMLGPYVVAGGIVSLPRVATSGYAGLGWVPYVETLDLRDKLQNEQPFRPPTRVYETELSLMNTGHVMLGANGEPPEEVPVRNLDGAVPPAQSTGEEPANDALDVAMMSRLYSGTRIIEGLEGWSEHGRIVITQSYPAPLTVRAVRYEVAYGS